MKTKRQKADDLLEKLRDSGVSDSMILEYIINDYMSSDEAFDALDAAKEELFNNDIDEEEEDEMKIKSFKERD